MKRLFGSDDADARPPAGERLDAERGRILIEESREIVVAVDDAKRVVLASRRARESLEGIREGAPIPESLLVADGRRSRIVVPYEVDGQRETLIYFNEPGDLAGYEELRAGFTAAVSHELRTPLARLLALLESALLPGEDPLELVEQARREVEQVRELIDDVLFLSELETGREVVSLGSTLVLPVLEEAAAAVRDRAELAGIALRVEGDATVELPLRMRMLRVIVDNLCENALRYAGNGTTFTLSVRRDGDRIVLAGADTGAGVSEIDLPRLFERFYRADRARASRGTGLGLAIVKHVVASAGGEVDARSAPGQGLEVRCVFPAR